MLYNQCNTVFKYLFLGIPVSMWIFMLLTLNYGFSTYYDEGYLLLSCDPSINSGYSPTESFYILKKIFTFIPLDIVYSRIIRYIIQVLYVFFVVYAGYIFIKKGYSSKNITFFYLVLMLQIGLLGFFRGPLCLNYNHLNSFFIFLSFSLFLLENITSRQRIYSFFYLFGIGFVVFYAIITIPPSGLLIFILYFFMIIYRTKESLAFCMKRISFYLLGIVLSSLIYFCFFRDFGSFSQKFAQVGMNLVNEDRGYSFISQIKSVLLYFQSFFFVLIYAIIAFFTCNFLRQKINTIVHSVVIVLFMFSIFIVAPNYATNQLLMPIFYLLTYFTYLNSKKIKSIIFNYETVFICFLLIFPFAATFGTNSRIVSKMAFNILPWGILFLFLLVKLWTKYRETSKSIVYSVSISFICMLFYVAFAQYKSIAHTNGNYFTSKYLEKSIVPMKNIYLNLNQIEYFKKIKEILNENGFKKNDEILTFFCDHATLYAMEAHPFEQLYYLPVSYINLTRYLAQNLPNYILLTPKQLKELEDAFFGFSENLELNYVRYELDGPDVIEPLRLLFIKK